jgi:hypothetical protein
VNRARRSRRAQSVLEGAQRTDRVSRREWTVHAT